MTVGGTPFEHDYPPTPFNEPIRPLPEAALKAEPTERTSYLAMISKNHVISKNHDSQFISRSNFS